MSTEHDMWIQVRTQAEEIARLRAARSDDAAVVLSLRQELNVSYPDLRAQVQALQAQLSEAQQRIVALEAECIRLRNVLIALYDDAVDRVNRSHA